SLIYSRFNGKLYDSLKCENDYNSYSWKSGAERVVEGYDQITAPCVDRVKIADGDGVATVKNGDTVEVTCKDSERSLFYANKPVKRSKATCNPDDGWSGSNLMEGADYKTRIHFECKEPPADSCKFDNAAGQFKFESTTRSLTCTEKDGKLVALSVNSIRYKS
ncbi:hypothetical protein PMAYCL1PPCAC_01132, partial [Pristionchus mayeri]